MRAAAAARRAGTRGDAELMLRVLIVDDHAVVREGLKRIIDESPGMSVCAEAGDARQALAALCGALFDVVVLDLDLPGRSGLDLLRRIKSGWPKLPVLVLSFHAEEAYAVPTFQAGADGYLMKDAGTALLLQAIAKVAAGGKFVTDVVAELLARNTGADAGQLGHAALSDRELEVLCMIGAGLPVSQIAGRLALSVKTVSTYRRRVLDKLGLPDNAAMMHYALRRGLID